MESVHKIDYKLAHVPTRAVVLFPGRAQVFRDIKDIELKPGINEVTLSGLSPTLDEDSVKVEGVGPAVITDISVESLPNQDNFQDVYPDEDSSDDDESDDEEPESEELRAAQHRIIELQDEMHVITETIASVDQRQTILDTRSDAVDTMEENKGSRLSDLMGAYRTVRAGLCQERLEAVKSERSLQKTLEDAIRRCRILERAALKESRERRNAKRRQREKEQRQRADRREERERIRQERIKFWPKYCYSVKVTLDVNTMTPQSSRRQSVASEADVVRAVGNVTTADEALADCTSCNLCISYVTSAAKWTPSYDLQLSTTGATATLCFDAKVSNQTSETWRNCRVSLSTSDAALAGVDTALPELTPWRIRLAGKSGGGGGRGDEEHITRSRQEAQEYRTFALAQKRRGTDTKPREDMFGLEENWAAASRMVQFESAEADEVFDDDCDLDMGRESDSIPGRKGKKKLSARARGGPVLMQAAAAPYAALAAAPAAPPPPPGFGGGFGGAALPGEEEEDDAVDFEDSLIEEAGMTTSYDLPGLKTLAPKSAASKQRVARVAFSSVTLSHSVVAKYRPVAYLQARLKNNSKLTLLPGPAGLTLDGSFMGRTPLPRCSAGDVFTLNLGVDPAVKVSYAKPEVRRATTGLFSKESSSVFARAVVLHNTRVATPGAGAGAGAGAAAKPARLHVLDQVPVSEDERLRVDVVTPRGLALEGPAVVAGAPGREEDGRDRDWGKATAQLRNGGEVAWDVRLNPGKMVKLWLEYAVSAPSGDAAVEC
ncbi:mucoidy inhibitor A [Cordyceps javanica]|uniref:Mucoidy inhibitor A n=1 Tax=Cordyceps javanica TaxID=43265 RepID=A0A545VKL9_9HYPO|nr:mucoidy inhibitor A [Cordyceps javanica]TQW02196.1 mucoidy inhibitor A [Cordyceps javanica]